jgi:Rho family, other
MAVLSPLAHLVPQQWIEEVRSICGSSIPVLLVGCKSDLRPPDVDNNAASHPLFVTRSQAERVAQVSSPNRHIP